MDRKPKTGVLRGSRAFKHKSLTAPPENQALRVEWDALSKQYDALRGETDALSRQYELELEEVRGEKDALSKR